MRIQTVLLTCIFIGSGIAIPLSVAALDVISSDEIAAFRASVRPSRRVLIQQSREKAGGSGTTFSDYSDRRVKVQQERTKAAIEKRSVRLIQNRTQEVRQRRIHGRGIRTTVKEHEIEEQESEGFVRPRRTLHRRISSFRQRFQRNPNADVVERPLKGGTEQRPIWHECMKLSGGRRAKCFYRTQRRTVQQSPELIE